MKAKAKASAQTFSNEDLEGESVILRIPPDAERLIRLRTTYFPIRASIGRHLDWRKIPPTGPSPTWEKIDLAPVKPFELIQTLTADLPLSGLGIGPGEMLEFRLIHVGYSDPLSVLLRLDVEFPSANGEKGASIV